MVEQSPHTCCTEPRQPLRIPRGLAFLAGSTDSSAAHSKLCARSFREPKVALSTGLAIHLRLQWPETLQYKMSPSRRPRLIDQTQTILFGLAERRKARRAFQEDQ